MKLTPLRSTVLLIAIVLCGAYAKAEELRYVATVDGKEGYEAGMGVLATPGQKIHIALEANGEPTSAVVANGGQNATASISEQFEWTAEKGELRDVTAKELVYECPKESGSTVLKAKCVHAIAIKGGGSEVSPTVKSNWSLHVFVQFPFDREGKGTIQNYPVGVYPDENSPRTDATVRDRAAAYHPPKWFARVAKSERGIRISPHFTIGQFCSPYTNEDPVYVAISPRLIDRLEQIHDRLITPERKDPRIAILRAFISPNEANQLRRKGLVMAEFSRYLYGDAASIILDQNSDGVMDDLNGDGKADLEDVDVLARIVEGIERDTKIYGGLGMYSGPGKDQLLPKTPFLAIDLRGVKSRFGGGGARESN